MKTHVAALFAELGASTRTEAVALGAGGALVAYCLNAGSDSAPGRGFHSRS